MHNTYLGSDLESYRALLGMLKRRAVVAHAEHGVLPQHGVGRRHRHRRGGRRSGLSAAVGRLGGGRQGREVRRNQLSIQRPGTPQFHRIFAAPSRGFLLTNADMTPTHLGVGGQHSAQICEQTRANQESTSYCHHPAPQRPHSDGGTYLFQITTNGWNEFFPDLWTRRDQNVRKHCGRRIRMVPSRLLLRCPLVLHRRQERGQSF